MVAPIYPISRRGWPMALSTAFEGSSFSRPPGCPHSPLDQVTPVGGASFVADYSTTSEVTLAYIAPAANSRIWSDFLDKIPSPHISL